MHNMTNTEMLKSAAARNGLKQGYAASLVMTFEEA